MKKLSIIKCITCFAAVFAISIPVNALEFALFGDATFRDNDAEGESTSFAVGAVDFFATVPIDDKTRAFIEYVFEGGDHGLVTDLERIWVARDLNDNLTLGAGRFHAPLGYWNRTYHHGSFMQDTVSRPFFLDFEDGAAGVLPVHTVGIMGWGETDVGSGTLGYEFAISNGSSIDTDEFGLSASPDGKPEIGINSAGDVNSNKSIGARIRYNFGTLPLHIAAFVNIQAVAEDGDGIQSGIGSGDALMDQTISGIDSQANIGPVSVLFEYYNFSHDSKIADGDSSSGSAYYLQLDFNINDDLKILFRNEDLSFDSDDPWFALLGAGEGNQNLVGARLELSDTNALKLEVARFSPEGDGDDNTNMTLQWTFMIP